MIIIKNLRIHMLALFGKSCRADIAVIGFIKGKRGFSNLEIADELRVSKRGVLTVMNEFVKAKLFTFEWEGNRKIYYSTKYLYRLYEEENEVK
jgi:hypothetical protein